MESTTRRPSAARMSAWPSAPSSTRWPWAEPTWLSASLCAPVLPAQTASAALTLRGYSNESARTQRDWETRFRAIPDPANVRAYMERLSARPHHVGSPYDKDNAEWMLGKLKEWGL